MRILLAAPDRDLLECYGKILEADFGETVTAFDGAQVISLISTENFDVVILDCDIPLAKNTRLIERVRDRGIPVIALINDPLIFRKLSENSSANAYLSYPFTPGELSAVIMKTAGNRPEKGFETVKENE